MREALWIEGWGLVMHPSSADLESVPFVGRKGGHRSRAAD
jgi:hypothetical protein